MSEPETEWERVTRERREWAQRVGARRLAERARQLADDARQARLFPELQGAALQKAGHARRRAERVQSENEKSRAPE